MHPSQLRITNKNWQIVKIMIFASILISMLVWPAAFIPYNGIINLLIVFAILILKKNWFRIVSLSQSLIYVWLLISIQLISLNGIKSGVSFCSVYFLGFLLFLLTDEYKEDLFSSITKWMSYLMIPSVVLYILHFFVSLPPVSILKSPFGYIDFVNYIFFVMPNDPVIIIPRFSGPFIEPGHLGMIFALFLYANKFDFKKNHFLYILLIASLLSLSLTAYVLIVLGYIIYKGIKVKQLIIYACVLGSIYLIAASWDSGDNAINQAIIERLEFDEDKGIKGNNRNFNYTDEYYHQMIADGTIIFGIGFDDFKRGLEEGKIGGAGITVYLMQYGIIGTILIFLYYAIIAAGCRNKYFSYGFLLLLSICFLQRAYPFWTSWLVPYITCMNKYNSYNKLLMTNKNKLS